MRNIWPFINMGVNVNTMEFLLVWPSRWNCQSYMVRISPLCKLYSTDRNDYSNHGHKISLNQCFLSGWNKTVFINKTRKASGTYTTNEPRRIFKKYTYFFKTDPYRRFCAFSIKIFICCFDILSWLGHPCLTPRNYLILIAVQNMFSTSSLQCICMRIHW